MTTPARSLSRPQRVARGSLAAVTSTVLAAGSHALGGAEVTALSVAATAALAWPVCVLLSGRAGSILRLTAAVVASQFVFHWSFAGLGASPGFASGRGAAVAAHTVHTSPVSGLSITEVAVAESTALMWASHALAAAVTIALIARGESAARSLRRLLHRVTRSRPTIGPRPARSAQHPPGNPLPFLLERLHGLSAMSSRGPPVRTAC